MTYQGIENLSIRQRFLFKNKKLGQGTWF